MRLERLVSVGLHSALLTLLAGCEGPTQPPPPPLRLALQVGESAVVTDPDRLSEFTIEGGEGPRAYRIAVQSASRAPSGNWPMRLTGGTSSTPAAATTRRASPRAATPAGEPAAGTIDGTPPTSALELAAAQSLAELRLRRNVRRELLDVRAQPARALEDSPGADGRAVLRTVARAEVPAVGERHSFLFSVQPDLSVSCTDTAAVIEASAKAVGDHFVIYRDLQANSGLSPADYQEVLATLESVIYPVASSYFGEPSDIDHNGRIVVLITEETNKLSGPSGLTFIAGFFVPSDLSDSGDPAKDGTSSGGICATSNEAEILYLIAPDPTAQFGRPHTVEFAKRTVIGVAAHELQHLINSERRLIQGSGGFEDLEDTWIDEGLSHLSEELNGLAAAGLPLRSDLTFAEAGADDTIFERFHLDNFARLGQTSGCGGWMASPEDTRTIVTDDPSGCSSLRFRGFAWLFMRWLGDHEGPDGSGVLPGSGEAALFRELVSGGPNHLRGIDNVERAVGAVGVGRSWEDLLADFLISPAADDRAPGAGVRTQILTWNLPDVYLGLHQDPSTVIDFELPYSLEVDALPFGPVARDFSVRSSTAKYFSLESEGATPDFTLHLHDAGGLSLPEVAAAQVTIVRLR